jgi:hypothetical protein
MNGTRTIRAVVFLLVLVLSALPAAAVSFLGQFHASKFNIAGSMVTNMTLSATTFCYLSRVFVEDADTDDEIAGCRVTRGPIVWTLEAFLGRSSDADSRCSAICYSN